MSQHVMNYKIILELFFNDSKYVFFLPSLKDLLYNNENKANSFRALLDSESECLSVGENVIKVKKEKWQNSSEWNYWCIIRTNLQFSNSQSRIEAFKWIFKGLDIHSCKVTSQSPAELLDTKNINYLKNITLTVENFMKPREYSIILSSGCFFTILRYGRIVSPENEPIAKTLCSIGW